MTGPRTRRVVLGSEPSYTRWWLSHNALLPVAGTADSPDGTTASADPALKAPVLLPPTELAGTLAAGGGGDAVDPPLTVRTPDGVVDAVYAVVVDAPDLLGLVGAGRSALRVPLDRAAEVGAVLAPVRGERHGPLPARVAASAARCRLDLGRLPACPFDCGVD